MPTTRIAEFDTWKPGYGGATVYVYRAGTTTLANIYTDEGLQVAATNPQQLLVRTEGGVDYGKFLVPLYTAQAYYLRINQIDDTGIERPALTGLDDEDALAGARAGLADITLDGISKAPTSVGVYSLNNDQLLFRDCEIKRFETGLYVRGGESARFYDLFVSDCSYGVRLHGDNDTSGGGLGGAMLFTRWIGGRVEFCTTAGIELKNADLPCNQTHIEGVGFDTNPGSAVRLDGARATYLHNCWWAGNTVNLSVDDGAILNTTNSIIDLTIQDGRFIDGDINLEGTLDSVVFRRVVFENVDVTLTLPLNNVVAQDCSETDLTLSGVATAWTRSRSNNKGASAGITTGNVATKAWAIALVPGQRVYLEVKAIGRGRNQYQDGFFHVVVSAWRPLAELDYDTQTGNFTTGNILTGATSGATARIVADADGGTTGTLGLQDISGTFLDNEIISDGATGSATVNGVMSVFDAALVGSLAAVRAAQRTDADWDVTFVPNGTEIECRVKGDTGQTVEWTVDVEVVST